MGVRCLGAITRDRLEALRETDAIVREETDKAGLSIWQYFAVVPDFRTTGVREGKRAYDWLCIIRCINTVDGMAAEVPELDWVLLKRITARDTLIAFQLSLIEACRLGLLAGGGLTVPREASGPAISACCGLA